MTLKKEKEEKMLVGDISQGEYSKKSRKKAKKESKEFIETEIEPVISEKKSKKELKRKQTSEITKESKKRKKDKKKKKEKREAASHDSDSDEEGEQTTEESEAPSSKKKAKKSSTVSGGQTENKKSKAAEENDSESNEASDMEVDEEKPDPCCILINNLAVETKEKSIKELFGDAGVEIQGALRRNTKKRTCYADISSRSQLSAAVNLSGTKLEGSTITIEHVPPKPSLLSSEQKQKLKMEQKKKQQDSEKCRTIFVGNAGFDTTEKQLLSHFPGSTSARLPIKKDGTAKGIAFVEFSSESLAESALTDPSLLSFKGRQLRLDQESNTNSSGKNKPKAKKSRFEYEKHAAKTGVAGKTKTLYVKNIAFSTTKQTLEAKFPECVAARLATSSKDGKPRGFAFLDFPSPEVAKASYDQMKDAMIDGRNIKLDFASELKEPPAKFGGSDGAPSCYNCGKAGHFSRACTKPKTGTGKGHNAKVKGKKPGKG